MSFRYNGRRTKRWYARVFSDIAHRYGLDLFKIRRLSRQVLEPRDLEAGEREIFSDIGTKGGRQRRVPSLSPERIEKLTGIINFEERVFQNKERTVKLIVQAADRNEFPCLMADVWVADDMKLPGGFIEVIADDKALIRSLRDALIGVTTAIHRGCREDKKLANNGPQRCSCGRRGGRDARARRGQPDRGH